MEEEREGRRDRGESKNLKQLVKISVVPRREKEKKESANLKQQCKTANGLSQNSRDMNLARSPSSQYSRDTKLPTRSVARTSKDKCTRCSHSPLLPKHSYNRQSRGLPHCRPSCAADTRAHSCGSWAEDFARACPSNGKA